MEKRKLDMSKAHDVYEIMELNAGDEVITVRTHIPYEQKVSMANELVELTVVPNDKLGICYTVGSGLVRRFLTAKYYTNIDTEDVSMEDIYDYLVNMDIVDHLDQIIYNDYVHVACMYEEMRGAVIKAYEAEHSLAQLAKSILDGKLDLQNEETRELIEKMIDMQAAYNKEQNKNNVLQFAKKKPAVGGLNLKKK